MCSANQGESPACANCVYWILSHLGGGGGRGRGEGEGREGLVLYRSFIDHIPFAVHGHVHVHVHCVRNMYMYTRDSSNSGTCTVHVTCRVEGYVNGRICCGGLDYS